MTPQQAEVAKWMLAFGQEVPSRPTVPPPEVLTLRANLIEEEGLRETVQALQAMAGLDQRSGAIHHLMAIDGLCDSLVVIYGAFVAFGLDATPLFDEVMRSNWTKLWTRSEFASRDDWELVSELVNDGERCILVKRKDGKVIKSPSYSPPNLLPIIEAQMKGTPHA